MTAPVNLDEGHRLRQAQNADQTRLLVQQLFLRLINPQNITGTAPAFLNQAVVAILRGRQSAWMLASAYATALRRLEMPDAPAFTLPAPEPVPREKLIRSLMFTGPGKLAVDLVKTPRPTAPDPDSLPTRDERETYERELEIFQQRVAELPAVAAVTASAAAYRHVTDGGRDLTHAVVANDPVAVGYIRVTRPDPCFFCAMLASRGPTYAKESFDKSDPRFEGEGEHKVHDSCGCTLKPIYGSKSTKNWTDQAREWEQLWIASGAKYSGARARLEFRRAYEARRPVR